MIACEKSALSRAVIDASKSELVSDDAISKEVKDFIDRRFKIDCQWMGGNCYYFSLILADRFKSYNPCVYYDPIDGHFLCGIGSRFYDFTGEHKYEKYDVEKFYKWDELKELDCTWYSRIVMDVLL